MAVQVSNQENGRENPGEIEPAGVPGDGAPCLADAEGIETPVGTVRASSWIYGRAGGG